jgi:hypothetical protein
MAERSEAKKRQASKNLKIWGKFPTGNSESQILIVKLVFFMNWRHEQAARDIVSRPPEALLIGDLIYAIHSSILKLQHSDI